MRLINAHILTLLLLAPLAVSAQQPAQVSIEADSLELDQQSGVSIYQGNVRLQQQDLLLQAERLELTSRQGKLQQVNARGTPVRLEQRDAATGILTRAEANEVEYRFTEGVLELRGDASLWRDGDEFSGQHLIFENEKQVVRAFGDSNSEGDGRVRVILTPQQDSANE